MKNRRASEIASVLFLIAASAHLPGQSRLWVATPIYESPTLLAPIVLVIIPDTADGYWKMGIFGWTLMGERTKQIDPGTATTFSAEVTPLNAHSANKVYRDGLRDKSLEFRDMTLQIKATLKLQHTRQWKSEFSLIGLHESVHGLSDQKVLDYWKRPFIGLEIAENYTAISSDDVIRSRREGVVCSGSVQVYAGATTWWRSTLTLEGGLRSGPIFFRGSGRMLEGNSLNTVNRFLVGGSWDLPGINTLYGYHYAEFRLDRASLLNAGADVQLIDNDKLEIGFRVGYVASPVKTVYGEAVKLGTVWNGIGFSLGVAFPEDSMLRGDTHRAIALASMSTALFEPR